MGGQALLRLLLQLLLLDHLENLLLLLLEKLWLNQWLLWKL